jgi:phospholipid/cholesterol/gamma-HCH transport system substrate-binding protein
MAILRRKHRSAQHKGMPAFRAGLIAIVIVALGSYFGFTKANPFANPYEVEAVFDTVNNLKPRSPVRIAGIDVGKVTKVEAIEGDGGAARVTMEIEDKGLPLHEDAELKIRPRIFLEGNFFVDLRPGSPSAPELADGATVPMSQTAAPVQFGDLLAALQSDTRKDLQIFLQEYSASLEDGGAEGFNASIPYWEPAYRNSAIANEASLGEEPNEDIQRILAGQAKVSKGLVRDEASLQDLISNFNTFAGSLAREDSALAASLPLLRDTLRVGRPALQSIDSALPSLRAFAKDALPGTRSSNEALRVSRPFIAQLRALFSPAELRGTAAALRAQIPNLADFNRVSLPLLDEGRQLSACTNKVLVPFVESRIPDPDFPANSDHRVVEQMQHSFPNLAGESRLSDGNNQFFHAGPVAPGPDVRPAPPTDGGYTPPPHRPDVPCETQEIPDLNAPGGPALSFPATTASVSKTTVAPAKPISKAAFRSGLLDAKRVFLRAERIAALQRMDQLAKKGADR